MACSSVSVCVCVFVCVTAVVMMFMCVHLFSSPSKDLSRKGRRGDNAGITRRIVAAVPRAWARASRVYLSFLVTSPSTERNEERKQKTAHLCCTRLSCRRGVRQGRHTRGSHTNTHTRAKRSREHAVFAMFECIPPFRCACRGVVARHVTEYPPPSLPCSLNCSEM